MSAERDSGGSVNGRAMDPEKMEILLTPAPDEDHVAFLIFSLGEMQFGIDILEIQGLHWVPVITPVHSAPEYVKGLLNLRGQVVTVFDLGRRLGLEECKITRAGRILIVRYEDEFIGFLVERILEVLTLPETLVELPHVNPLETPRSFLSGVVQRGNRLITVLDVQEIVKVDL